ncbi:hypothetical protein [Pelomonas sp. BJYL3]|uniref:hypothetical protein n=1 Tax=Pelomonas sp. BJYL3 TaxID=2976697 RepID=UPI0022B52578|nr:hypothetical protein [Pelomonas sp. BJYL3]
MILDKERYQKFFDGYFVRDATFGFTHTRLGLLLVEESDPDEQADEHWQTKLVALNLDQPMESRVFSWKGNSLDFASISSAWEPSQTEYLAVDVGRRVWSYKPKTYKGSETPIPFPAAGKLKPDAYSEFDCAIMKTVRVGSTVFAVGGPFRVFERTANQQWIEHKDIPIPAAIGSADRETALHAIGNSGFEDLAGLSPDDMYAVGREGTIWQRTQGQWRQRAFPSNLDLFTVAVAPDGTAYITDRRCSVWKGQEERWERIVQADSTLPYQDSAWFAGRLWCTNDSAGPFVLEGKKMVPAHQAKKDPMPAQVACFAHRIDVSPDGKTMLVAGRYGAATYDGKTWTVLFDGMPDD